MKFSIIIPIYNNLQFLSDCLYGCLRQNFPSEEFEIILVDDASTEDVYGKSRKIYHNYKAKFKNCPLPRFNVLRHEINKRQGGARNTGLKASKGEYIIFLDSDDYWIADNVLLTFADILKDESFDVVRSTTWICAPYEKLPTLSTIKFNGISDRMMGKEHLNPKSFFCEIWTSAYKRSLLVDNGIEFRENVWFEDSDWTIKVSWYAKKIALIDFPFYVYRLNPDSTTSQPRLQMFRDNITSTASIEDFIKEVEMSDDIRKTCYNRIKDSILLFIKLSRHYSIEESLRSLKLIRPCLLQKTDNYDLSFFERIQFGMLRNCPLFLTSVIRDLTLLKRLFVKILKKCIIIFKSVI